MIRILTLSLMLVFSTPFVGSSHSQETSANSDSDPFFNGTSHISSNAGPQTITRNILQDSKGGYWLATWDGLMRFDGSTFTNLTNKDGLKRHRAFSLMEDHQNNIWLGTIGAGLYRYDGSAYTNFTKDDGLVDDAVLAIMQDSENNIWLGSMGASKYDGTTFTSFTTKDGFTDSDVNAIAQAPDGTIWFGTRGALFQYDGKKFVNFTKKHGVDIASHSYTPMVIDRKGHVWFSGETGLFHYDGEQVRHLFEPTCFSLMEDSQGNIWYSGGTLKSGDAEPGSMILNRFDPAAGLDSFLAASEQIEIKDRGMIFGLTEDQNGSIWFGTGRGVGRIEGDTVLYY